MRFVIPSIIIGSLAACATVTPGQAIVQVDVCGTQEEDSRYSIIKGGRVWDTMCTDIYRIPTREQREVWSATPEEGETADQSITFAGIDGQKVSVDVSLSYQVLPEDNEIIKMVKKFGPNLEATIDGRVRDSTRNALQMCAASQALTVQDIYGSSKEALFACVEKAVSEEYTPHGLSITRLSLNSEVRLPKQVAEAMERAQAATQEADKARREVEKTEAVGAQSVAQAKAEAEATLTRAAAEAEANRIVSQSLTPAVLEMRRLEIELAKAKAWDGKLPSTVVGSEAAVLFDLGDRK